MRFAHFTSCVLALACLAASANAQELPADATEALAEYAVKRADVMRRADAELAKHKQTLIKKMQKVQQATAGNPDAEKQVAQLMLKINGPAFTTFEIEEILKGTATTINTFTAKQVEKAYTLNKMTEEQWHSLPAVAVAAKCCTFVDTKVEAKPGDVFLICPNPAEKWRHKPTVEWATYVGKNDATGRSEALCMVQNTADKLILSYSRLFETKTAGKLLVGSKSPGYDEGAEGLISFKIFRVQDR